jgi:hypothetical protein
MDNIHRESSKNNNNLVQSAKLDPGLWYIFKITMSILYSLALLLPRPHPTLVKLTEISLKLVQILS